MCRKGLKRMGIFFLSIFLVFSLPVLSFADTKGKMDPDDYLFLTVFRACGVSPGVDVGRWVGLYKGYLRATGNTALLSQVEGYASLGWGDTASGVDTLFESVKGWLSLSGSYGTDASRYSLPSSPSPQIYDLCVSPYISISSQPFPEGLREEPGYSYVFSQSFKDKVSAVGFRENYYFPDGAEVIALARPDYRVSNEYFDGIGVTFYMVDASSTSGYSLAPCFVVWTTYAADGSTLNNTVSRHSSSASVNPDICSLMNFPVYVFASAEDMETYCKTGVVNNIFNSNSGFVSSLGKDGGLDPELQKLGFVSIGNQMTLPSSQTEAVSRAAAFQKPLSRQQLTDILGQNGMDDLTYMAEYHVEHYRKNPDPEAQEEWTLADTEVFTGISGTEAAYSVKDYPHYLFDSSLTKPSDRKILPDNSLVVRLYYTPDPEAVYPYTVEYYKDGECFETVSKTVPMFGDRTVSEYEDFCPKYYLVDGETSTPLPFSVTGENHVIRVSYIPDLDAVYPYTVEYYKDGECFETVSGTVPVFGDQTVQEYKDVCPKYYLVDGEASTPLPFPVTEENHVIRVYYIPDTSNPYTPLARGTEDLVTFTSGFFGKVFLGVLALLLLGLFINRSLAFVKRTTSQAEAGKYKQGKKSDTPRRYSKRKGNRYKYRGRRKHANY